MSTCQGTLSLKELIKQMEWSNEKIIQVKNP